MSDTNTIRTALLIQYPQIFAIAKKSLLLIKTNDPTSTLLESDILNTFIEKSKLYHNPVNWGYQYDNGVILLACHFLTESQSEATNSGVIVSQTTGRSDNANQTEFIRPSVTMFGKYSTTKYGRQWEALKETILPDNWAFIV